MLQHPPPLLSCESENVYEYAADPHLKITRRGGAEVAGWTLDRKIRVRFPAYPHRAWALWWQGVKRPLRKSRCPCRGRLGTLKTPTCPWRGCPAAGQNLETGHLSRHYIAEISLNETLNLNQHQQQHLKICLLCIYMDRLEIIGVSSTSRIFISWHAKCNIHCWIKVY